MATRLFPDDQMERLKSYPDIGTDELIRFFTLTPADVAFVDPGRGRGPADRLGLAVQLCTLPWLGFMPDEVRAAPPVAVMRLACGSTATRRPCSATGSVRRHVRIICGWCVTTSGGGPRRPAGSR